LKTPKFHSEINWHLDTYDHIDDRGQIKPRRISHNWTAPVCIICIQEGHNWWWSIQNETAFEILMSENLPQRLHFFCLETCHVVYELTPSVYLLASDRLYNFSMVGHKKQDCSPKIYRLKGNYCIFDREQLANAVQGITIRLVDLLPTFCKPFTQFEAYLYVMLCNTS
jgi:hypothetical protein